MELNLVACEIPFESTLKDVCFVCWLDRCLLCLLVACMYAAYHPKTAVDYCKMGCTTSECNKSAQSGKTTHTTSERIIARAATKILKFVADSSTFLNVPIYKQIHVINVALK